MYPYVPGIPGLRSARTSRHKIVFKGGYDQDILPGGKNIDGTKSRDPSNSDNVAVLQPGLLMGKITSSSLYAPSIMGVTTGALIVGATSITAAAAVITELVRRVGATGTFVLRGPAAANGTVENETVTYSAASGTTITCTAITKAYVSGSFIQPTDGSDEPITLLPDGHGMPVLEFNGDAVSIIEFPEMPINGIIISSAIVNWPSDTSLRAWIKTRLSSIDGGKFTFDDVYN